MSRHGGTPPPHGWASTSLVIGFGVQRSLSTRVFPQPARTTENRAQDSRARLAGKTKQTTVRGPKFEFF